MQCNAQAATATSISGSQVDITSTQRVTLHMSPRMSSCTTITTTMSTTATNIADSLPFDILRHIVLTLRHPLDVWRAGQISRVWENCAHR